MDKIKVLQKLGVMEVVEENVFLIEFFINILKVNYLNFMLVKYDGNLYDGRNLCNFVFY